MRLKIFQFEFSTINFNKISFAPFHRNCTCTKTLFFSCGENEWIAVKCSREVENYWEIILQRNEGENFLFEGRKKLKTNFLVNATIEREILRLREISCEFSSSFSFAFLQIINRKIFINFSSRKTVFFCDFLLNYRDRSREIAQKTPFLWEDHARFPKIFSYVCISKRRWSSASSQSHRNKQFPFHWHLKLFSFVVVEFSPFDFSFIICGDISQTKKESLKIFRLLFLAWERKKKQIRSIVNDELLLRHECNLM